MVNRTMCSMFTIGKTRQSNHQTLAPIVVSLLIFLMSPLVSLVATIISLLLTVLILVSQNLS